MPPKPRRETTRQKKIAKGRKKGKFQDKVRIILDGIFSQSDLAEILDTFPKDLNSWEEGNEVASQKEKFCTIKTEVLDSNNSGNTLVDCFSPAYDPPVPANLVHFNIFSGSNPELRKNKKDPEVFTQSDLLKYYKRIMKAPNVVETDVLKRGHTLHYALPFFPMPKPREFVLSRKDMIVAMVYLYTKLLPGDEVTFQFIRGRVMDQIKDKASKISFQEAIAPLLVGTTMHGKLLEITQPSDDKKKKHIDNYELSLTEEGMAVVEKDEEDLYFELWIGMAAYRSLKTMVRFLLIPATFLSLKRKPQSNMEMHWRLMYLFCRTGDERAVFNYLYYMAAKKKNYELYFSPRQIQSACKFTTSARYKNALSSLSQIAEYITDKDSTSLEDECLPPILGLTEIPDSVIHGTDSDTDSSDEESDSAYSGDTNEEEDSKTTDSIDDEDGTKGKNRFSANSGSGTDSLDTEEKPGSQAKSDGSTSTGDEDNEKDKSSKIIDIFNMDKVGKRYSKRWYRLKESCFIDKTFSKMVDPETQKFLDDFKFKIDEKTFSELLDPTTKAFAVNYETGMKAFQNAGWLYSRARVDYLGLKNIFQNHDETWLERTRHTVKVEFKECWEYKVNFEYTENVFKEIYEKAYKSVRELKKLELNELARAHDMTQSAVISLWKMKDLQESIENTYKSVKRQHQEAM